MKTRGFLSRGFAISETRQWGHCLGDFLKALETTTAAKWHKISCTLGSILDGRNRQVLLSHLPIGNKFLPANPALKMTESD